MADEVKTRARKAADFRRFGGEFLHIVFAEFAQAQCISLANRRCRKDLCDGQQRDARRIAARPLGRCLDARADRCQPFRQSLRRR